MVRLKFEIEDFTPSMAKSCKKPFQQIVMKPQETLEFKRTQPIESFLIEPSFNFGLDSKWMFVLTRLEVYSSNFKLTEENTKFELYTDLFDEFSFTKMKDEP